MEPFKNLLGIHAAEKIAKAINRVDRNFSSKEFLAGLEKELEPLELKTRMLTLSRRLGKQLSSNPKDSFPLLVESLKKSDQDNVGLTGFLVWPLTQYVAENGLEHFKESMTALKEMTKVFTGEFAVRPFFIAHEEKTLKQFMVWTNDKNEHVRRFVSEGSRPLLPWGQKLPRFAENPNLTWPLLEQLKADPSKYVQKSVANHMNDLSKHHPDWLVNQLKTWPNPWVVRHGTRTLIKKGHAGALKLQGISGAGPAVSAFKIKKVKLRLGETLDLSLSLRNKSTKEMKTVVDVEIHFLKANGKHSGKVFKGKSLVLKPKSTASLSIRIPLKKVTTRKYYSGNQLCGVIVNGKKTKPEKFSLQVRK